MASGDELKGFDASKLTSEDDDAGESPTSLFSLHVRRSTRKQVELTDLYSTEP